MSFCKDKGQMSSSVCCGYGNTDWTNKGDHMASDVAFGKAGASVRKEILPFALEGFIIRTVLQCGMVLNKEVLGKISF